MLTTNPTQQSPATTALPEPAANESFCTWLYDRIKDVFQTILSWLCCCPRADVPASEPASTSASAPTTSIPRTGATTSTTLPPPVRPHFDYRTEAARALCAREGYQHIVVLEARLRNRDVVPEHQSPSHMEGRFENIRLYMENPSQFTHVAQEFAALQCKALVGCQLIDSCSYYPTNERFAVYKHFTLYLEGEEGKLGLFDLSEFQVTQEDTRSDRYHYYACEKAIYHFPFHFNEILATVTQMGRTLTADERTRLTQLRDREQQRFNNIHLAHAASLRANNITLANPLALPVVTPARQRAILDTLVTSIHDQPAEAITRFSEQLPEIWNIALNLITQLLNTRTVPNTTLPERLRFIKMLSSRSFMFYNTDSPCRTTINALKEKLNMCPFNNLDINRVAEELLDNILTKLAQGGEIFRYEKRMIASNVSQYCLFC